MFKILGTINIWIKKHVDSGWIFNQNPKLFSLCHHKQMSLSSFFLIFFFEECTCATADWWQLGGWLMADKMSFAVAFFLAGQKGTTGGNGGLTFDSTAGF